MIFYLSNLFKVTLCFTDNPFVKRIDTASTSETLFKIMSDMSDMMKEGGRAMDLQ